jgi:hypothetical protein
MSLAFSQDLADHLAWDAQQAHPNLPPQTTGPDGTTNFAIRGGGCWPSGSASLRSNGVEVRRWSGAKSPDVNGDCRVLSDDLAYVTSRLGTADFCADLNGDGTVTQVDVAIVQAAMGQLCSQLAGVEEPGPQGGGFRILPNPSSGVVTLEIDSPSSGPVAVEILDAAGRLVRAWSAPANEAGTARWTWDGRDRAGRAVASGAYFARARSMTGVRSGTILIAR